MHPYDIHIKIEYEYRYLYLYFKQIQIQIIRMFSHPDPSLFNRWKNVWNGAWVVALVGLCARRHPWYDACIAVLCRLSSTRRRTGRRRASDKKKMGSCEFGVFGFQTPPNFPSHQNIKYSKWLIYRVLNISK